MPPTVLILDAELGTFEVVDTSHLAAPAVDKWGEGYARGAVVLPKGGRTQPSL